MEVQKISLQRFRKVLRKKDYASGPALKKLQDRNIQKITSFNAENLSDAEAAYLADQLAKKCLKGQVFAWSGIPTVQVGHERNKDIFVRAGLCHLATSAKEIVQAMSGMKEEPISEKKIS